MSAKKDKQYGLILPKKQQVSAPKVGNVFGDDNASDEEDGTDWVKKALKAEGEKHKMKRQTKLNMQKALREDPTIYQYDEVYDDMEREKTQTKVAKSTEKKPKYIENLLKAAERRKKEQEHRIERMVQKEREAEGEMFADKESFVTSAYRAKLEEFKKMEEEDTRIERLESIGDVTKQQDLSGFYRHFYEQTVDKPMDSDKDSKTNNNLEVNKSLSSKVDDKQDTVTFPNKAKCKSEEDSKPVKTKKSRQYRKRLSDTDESESEIQVVSKIEEKNKQIVPSGQNNDANTDVHEPDKKKLKHVPEVAHSNPLASSIVPAAEKQNKNVTEKDSSKLQDENTTRQDFEKDATVNCDKNEESGVDENVKIVTEKRDRSQIWKKRTVGPVLEAALQRYYARKAAKASGALYATNVPC